MEKLIKMPECAAKIIEKLEKSGYKAYAVGGCIRDSIMGKVPYDWDICTSALPEEVLKVLGERNIVENGLKHGTVTVHINGENYEITTFRTDGEYVDNRHPENVTFVRDLKDDLSRRDFTMNALAYNDSEGLTDIFGGKDDINNGIIRCVGDPDKRFNEDALRILRALRFSSQLCFSIDEKTSVSIHKNAELLKNISAERIMSEFTKILMGRNVEKVLLDYSDVIAVFIPEIKAMSGFEQHNPHHVYDVWEHTVKAVACVKNERILRLAAFFHDIGKPNTFTMDDNEKGHFHGHPEVSDRMANEILKRLKTDNNTISKVRLLIKLHDLRPKADAKNVRRLMYETGSECFPLLMEIKRADTLAQNPETHKYKLEYIARLEEIYKQEPEKKSAFNLKTLAVNGRDIINMGIKDGRKIGMILEFLLDRVIDGDIENDKQVLLEKAAEIQGRFL